MSEDQQPLAAALEATLERGRKKLYSVSEEIAHAITHGLGVVLAIAGLTVLVARATLYGNVWHIVSCAIFGTTLVTMYMASTLFHSIPQPRAKHILRVIDHTSIYFLIAGTYTPFTLVTLHGTWGWWMFGATWGLALFGAVFKIFYTGRFEKLSLAVYLGMGWCMFVAVKPLLHALAPGGLILLLLGGLSYTGGVAFYVFERMRYHHAIWHVFVLAGSVFHYFAVFFYVVPGPA